MAQHEGQKNTAIPRELTSFVGRERELEALSAMTREGAALITVTGPAGMGKTRLVQRWLASSELDLGARWFCDLRGVTTHHDLAAKITEVVDRVQASGPPGTDLATAVGRLLRAAGKATIVLDNFETLVPEGIDTLAQWIHQAPETQFVVTSRQMLRLQAERILEMTPLSLTTSGRDPSEALLLFDQRAKAVEPSFNSAANPEVRTLVERLEGIPLALELAAGQMRQRQPSEVLTQLDHTGAIGLTTSVRDIDPRHRSLRAAIDSSWEILTSFEQRVLTQLSVFRQGFTLAAVETVLGSEAESHPQQRLADAITSLREATLLRIDETESGSMRWDMYEAIRQYASQFATTSDRSRHAAYYLANARRWMAELRSANSRDARPQVARELGNVRAALEWYLQDTSPERLSGAAELALLIYELHRTDRPALAVGPLTAILERATSRELRVRLFTARGVCHRTLGHNSYAHADFQAARACVAENTLNESELDIEEAALDFCRGDIRRARSLLQRAAHGTQHKDTVDLEIRAHVWLSTVLNQGFQDPEAFYHCDRAIELARNHRRVMSEPLLRTMRAACEQFQRTGIEIEETIRSQIDVAAESGDRYTEVFAEQVLGMYLLDEDRLDESRAHLLRSRKLAQECGYLRVARCASKWLFAVDETRGIPANLAERRCIADGFRDVGDPRNEAFALLEASAQVAHHSTVERGLDQLASGSVLGQQFEDDALSVLAEIQRARIELLVSDALTKSGDLQNARTTRDQAEKRITYARQRTPTDASDRTEGPTVISRSPETRWALRLYERERALLGPRRPVLRVSMDGGSFRLGGDLPVHLPDGPVIRRALLALAENHCDEKERALTLDDFMERCWPGERTTPTVSSQRVRQVVTRLRKAGLGKRIEHDGTGYRLNRELEVTFVPPSIPGDNSNAG